MFRISLCQHINLWYLSILQTFRSVNNLVISRLHSVWGFMFLDDSWELNATQLFYSDFEAVTLCYSICDSMSGFSIRSHLLKWPKHQTHLMKNMFLMWAERSFLGTDLWPSHLYLISVPNAMACCHHTPRASFRKQSSHSNGKFIPQMGCLYVMLSKLHWGETLTFPCLFSPFTSVGNSFQ
jgi:hypothetical protein